MSSERAVNLSTQHGGIPYVRNHERNFIFIALVGHHSMHLEFAFEGLLLKYYFEDAAKTLLEHLEAVTA